MVDDIKKCSIAQIGLYQEMALKELLQYLKNKSVFYQDLFHKNGIDIANIKTITDLVNIPTTTKSDFSKRNFDFLCVARGQIIDYSTTSGTTGKPAIVALTEKDLQRLAYNEEQSFICAGGRASDIYQMMLTIDRQFIAGMAYFLGIRKMGAGLIRVGPASPKVQWDVIQSYRPNSIVVVPSFILKLIEYAELNGIDLNNSGIEKAICIGEPVGNNDLMPNMLAKKIKEKWNIKLFSTYASTEMQTAFTECEHGAGGHLQPDLIIVEILDDRGNQLKSGDFGEVTITTLGVEGMPLLRYRTGDICCYYDEPCKCGRNTIRLSPIIGRKNQMIKYKGTTFFPPVIYDALGSVPEVIDYLVEVTKNENGGDDIVIHIAHTGNNNEIAEKITASIKAIARVSISINFVSMQQIRLLKASDNRKPVSVLFK